MVARKLWVSNDLGLPLDWITLSTVVYGARGSGKTTLGSVIAEEVLDAGQRFCAIDLKGDWWGLKSSADGNSAGKPVVIFGGDHADLPLEADAGAFIAETIAALEQSAILDLEHLSKGRQLRFLAAFFERLYDKNREPLLLMLDEAQRYAPQKPMSPEANVCLGAVEDLVKLGRKHGIGPMLFTQRGSGLNKEVSELCDMLVAFRTPGSLDQDRIKDWLGANAGKDVASELLGAISGLPTGTAVIASNHPQLRDALVKTAAMVKVRPRHTFDSSATPKVGQRRREPKILAQPELEALKERMSEAIERAKADDPKELRAELARLRAELARKPAVQTETVVETKIEYVDRPILSDADRTFLESLHRTLQENASIAEGAAATLKNAAEDYLSVANRLSEVAAQPEKRFDLAPVIPIRPPTSEDRIERDLQRSIARVPMRENEREDSNGLTYSLSKGEIAFLNILAQYPAGRSKSQLAVLAGYSPRSGGNDQILANLRRLEAIDGKASLLTITEKGREILGDAFEPLPTGEELRQYWMNNAQLSSGARGFLKLLIGAYPDSMSKAALAEALGYSPKSGGNDQILADLRRRDLITGTAAALRASDDLFQ